MDDNETITIHLERVGSSYAAPTRQCLVCDRMENQGGTITIVHTGLAWLCPECKSRIKNLLYKEGNI